MIKKRLRIGFMIHRTASKMPGKEVGCGDRFHLNSAQFGGTIQTFIMHRAQAKVWLLQPVAPEQRSL
jgi:hypothetical protein